VEDSLKKHVDFYNAFIETTEAGHKEAKTRRNYVNNIQWTAEEIAELNKRKQPVITDNRIKRKTDYFLGIERQTRTDPKAFPRTPEHEDGSNAVTDALRYICDNNDWDIERSEAFDSLIVEGIEGYSVPVAKLPNGEIEIRVNHIPWDRIIYDYHSTDRFFRDAKKKGVIVWMDEDDAMQAFKEKKEIIEMSFAMNSDDSDIFDDKPEKAVWADRVKRRLKVIQLYYLEKGTWTHCVFTKAGYLVDPAPSKYLDEYGQPDCPIELGSAYIDKDNDRFGLVQDMISLQDMVNKGHSKYMHFINSNQTWGNAQGPNANVTKKQAKMPDGHFELEGDGKFGEDFGIVPTDNKAVGTFNITQQAIQSLAEIGGNSLVDDQASGRSKEVTAQTKIIELGPVLDTHRQLSKMVYKHMWNRVKQFWTGPKWIRVTDDEDNIKFTQLNQPVTYADALKEKFGEIPPQALNSPFLNQVREVKNKVDEMDVDIIVEEAPDIINIQQEQFQVLADLARTYGPQEVPFEQMLKLSSLRNKDQFVEQTKGSEEQRQAAMMQQQQIQQMQVQMAMEKEQIAIAKEKAELQGIPISNEIQMRELALKEKEIMLKEYEIAQKINGDNTRIQEANIKANADVNIAQIDAAARVAESGKETEEKQPIQIINQIPNGDKRVSVTRTENGLEGEAVSI